LDASRQSGLEGKDAELERVSLNNTELGERLFLGESDRG